jgi:hypothetical protein
MLTITIGLPEVMTCKVRGHEVKLDLASANGETQRAIAERLVAYGMRKFNDASPMGETAPTDEAGKVRFAQDCANNAREMIKDWLAGNFETERSGGRAALDPVQKRIRELAEAIATHKLGKPGKDAAKIAEWKVMARGYMESPKVKAQAEKDVAALADFDL